MSKKQPNYEDPRRRRSRQLIRNALLDLIHERGYEAITVQDITDRAGLNRATFYLHYHDKHDLMLGLMNEVLGDLKTLPTPLQSNRPYEVDLARLEAFFIGLFQHVALHADFYRLMVVEGSVASFAGQMQAHIEQFGLRWFARAGNRRYVIAPEVVMGYLSGAYMGMVKWWLTNNRPNAPEAIAAQFMQLALPGILQMVQEDTFRSSGDL